MDLKRLSHFSRLQAEAIICCSELNSKGLRFVAFECPKKAPVDCQQASSQLHEGFRKKRQTVRFLVSVATMPWWISMEPEFAIHMAPYSRLEEAMMGDAN